MIVARNEARAGRDLCRRDMKSVQAAGESLRRVESGELARACKHLVQVWRRRYQPLCLHVLSELSEDRVALLPRDRPTPDQHLERVRDLQGTHARPSMTGGWLSGRALN